MVLAKTLITAIGFQSLTTVRNSHNNTAIGKDAGKLITGGDIMYIGNGAGETRLGSDFNTIIGMLTLK